MKFDSDLKKKRVVGLVILAVLLGLFLWFNRIPKLDTVEQDLVLVTVPFGEAQCFQGLCIDGNPEQPLLERWWEFSLTYLELVALGMTFAFLVAGLTEAFLFPPEARGGWSGRGIKGSLRGMVIGPAMNLCSACIVPVSASFRRRGAGVETTVAIVQGSATMNLPALIMAALVFTPMLAGSRVGVSVVGALLLGPLVAWLARPKEPEAAEEPSDVCALDLELHSWREIVTGGVKQWLRTSFGYFLRLGPVMVLAGFASGLVIQWISPDTVERYLGDNATGIVIAATLGLLINVPLMFEIPLVAALLMVGMGTAPAATLLFAAAAGGPITFWGLSRYLSRKTVAVFAAATWILGALAGLAVLGLGVWTGVGQPSVIQIAGVETSNCPGCLLRTAVAEAERGAVIQVPPGTYSLLYDELVLRKDVTLAGAGAGRTILQAAYAPGEATHRVISVEFGATVEISGMTVRHGLVDSREERHIYFPATNSGALGYSLEFGGGIHVHGTLTLRDVEVTGNQAGGGGGIFNGGFLSLYNTRVRDNEATGIGGGIFNGGIVLAEATEFAENRANSGGAIYNLGEMTVSHSSIRANEARVSGGGLLTSSIGSSVLEHSDVTGNTALTGGGLRVEGRLTASDSTVTGNTARRGGGVFNLGRVSASNMTISGNQAVLGGGIATQVSSRPPETRIANTVLAGNAASEEGPDCAGNLEISADTVLGSRDGCLSTTVPGNLISAAYAPGE